MTPATGQILVAPRERLPLRRPVQGRWVGGVCLGIAAHLDLPVRLVRAVMLVLTAAGGLGMVLYVFWWVTVPSGDPAQAAEDARPAALTRLAPRLRFSSWASSTRSGVQIQWSWVAPTVLLLGGIALAWSQLDAGQRQLWRSRAGGRTPVSVLRLAGGLALVGLGVLLLVGQNESPSTLVRSAVAAGSETRAERRRLVPIHVIAA